MTELDPGQIFAALAEASVDYVTVGGFAVVAHGVARATVDVDLIPAGDRPNLERLASALAALDARPDGERETRVTGELLALDEERDRPTPPAGVQ